ncbi:MAG: zinc metallopeptidase [Cyanobacteria bacterium K_Offshore_surface_m2_239]|nr:zinc metallopeptidase [Cyanobacteria bacterium K_Offshore_surface_m2_239]
MFFDTQSLLLTLPALGFSLWAQWRVKSTFQRFAEVGVRSGFTGAEAAEAVLRSAGVQGVKIERHQGFLSDHYDPLAKALRLSPHVHDGRSISSIAVAAHEAGHAIQDKVGYVPLVWRSALVPLCNVGSTLWFFPFLAGILLRQLAFAPLLMWIGIGLFATVVLFQLITLPTEFNASNRAKAVLASTGIVSTRAEADGVKQVLDAAALTYVAAAAAAVMQLLDLVPRQTRQ